MRIREAIESGSGALCVGAHILKVQPVTDIKGVVEADALGDVINSIARGAENGVLGPPGNGLRGGDAAVEGAVACTEDLSDRVLVVEHDAREVSIDAVVEVDHVAVLGGVGVGHGAARDDVTGEREGGGNVVASWLGDDGDVSGDVLVEGFAEDRGHGFKVLAGEAAADVDGLEGEALGGGLVHDGAGVADGFEEGERVAGAGADVEADTYDVEAQLLGEREELDGSIQRSSELHAEAAQAGGVIGDDAEEELRVWEELLDLVQLVGVIESHLLDSAIGCVSHVRLGLAWLSVDDPSWVNAHLQDLLDFGLGGTVKPGSQLSEKANDFGVGVALDRYFNVSPVFNNGQSGKRTIERLNPWKVQFPSHVLPVDIAQVSDEEGILLASFACFVINILDPIL